MMRREWLTVTEPAWDSSSRECPIALRATKSDEGTQDNVLEFADRNRAATVSGSGCRHSAVLQATDAALS